MMKRTQLLLLAYSWPCLLLAEHAVDNSAAANQKEKTWVIDMHPCQASRQKINLTPADVSQVLEGKKKFEDFKDNLVLKGDLEIDQNVYSFYLEELSSGNKYSQLLSKGKKSPTLRNLESSLFVSIDANQNGKIEDTSENWPIHLPIRLENKMVEITEISPDGSKITLKESKSPLRGLVLDQPAPHFSFKTMSGKEVGLEDYRGKTLILDVWGSL